MLPKKLLSPPKPQLVTTLMRPTDRGWAQVSHGVWPRADCAQSVNVGLHCGDRGALHVMEDEKARFDRIVRTPPSPLRNKSGPRRRFPSENDGPRRGGKGGGEISRRTPPQNTTTEKKRKRQDKSFGGRSHPNSLTVSVSTSFSSSAMVRDRAWGSMPKLNCVRRAPCARPLRTARRRSAAAALRRGGDGRSGFVDGAVGLISCAVAAVAARGVLRR